MSARPKICLSLYAPNTVEISQRVVLKVTDIYESSMDGQYTSKYVLLIYITPDRYRLTRVNDDFFVHNYKKVTNLVYSSQHFWVEALKKRLVLLDYQCILFARDNDIEETLTGKLTKQDATSILRRAEHLWVQLSDSGVWNLPLRL
mgnify:CR=1 FL=1